MDKAVREIPEWNEFVWNDWPGGGPLSYWPHWSAFTESGVMGDPTVATAEKGRLWLERACTEAASFIAETVRRAHTPGRDHHGQEENP
jgi:creatinine amidohydrolase/Fe(II)-dependent formamide hydrolase-like protein